MFKRFNIFLICYLTPFILAFSQSYEEYYKNWQNIYNIDFFYNTENKVEISYKYAWRQHPSGIRYTILKEGVGDSPSSNDITKVHYTGMLSNGKIFDSSIERGKSVTFPLSRIIPGLKESIQLLNPNGIGVFLIPSELAYGGKGLKDAVPPNTSLIFWIHLIDYEDQDSDVKDASIYAVQKSTAGSHDKILINQKEKNLKENDYPDRENLTDINSNVKKLSEEKEEEIYVAVEKPAEFEGGQGALIKWISQNLRYPESALNNDIQGRVVVKFVVEKDGIITHAEIARSLDEDLDKEALRVVSLMPKWRPGMNNGVPVRSYFNLPITFKSQ